MLRVILQHRANVPEGEVQTLFIIYECLRSPDLLGQVLPSDHLSGTAYQDHQYLCGLRLEL